MPTFPYQSIERKIINGDGVTHMTGVNLIGPDQGWADHTLRVFRLGPDGHSPHHQHDWEHVNYVISGRGRLTIGEKVYELGPKGFAFVPPNTMHRFENPYDEDFEFICIVPNRGATVSYDS